MWQYTTGRPHYLKYTIYSWPLDRQEVSLISDQGYFTFIYGHTKHNWEGRRKEEKTIMGLG